MKGKAPTKAEKAFHDRIAQVGCIACKLEGIDNQYVSIHHIEGRTKPGAHYKVLPLCSVHHQYGTEEFPSVHPWKARFEDRYGSQLELLELCKRIIDGTH